MRQIRWPPRGVWVTYGVVGALAAVFRVGLLMARVGHPTRVVWELEWCLLPEGEAFGLIAGSFLMTTPVLFVGWLLQGLTIGRRVMVWYLSCGTVLAIIRTAVLVWVHGDTLAAPWSLLWVLCPEALLVVGTRYEASFVFLALVGVGSFVMAMPILLVGWWRSSSATWSTLERGGEDVSRK